jgi:hypothetical protein
MTGQSQARGDWNRVAQEIDRWDGPMAVVSMEFLSLASSAGVARAMEMHDWSYHE